MRRTTTLALSAAICAACALWCNAPASAGPAASGGPRVSLVSLVIGNRVFPDFSDHQKVKLNQEFTVGDTDYSARIVQYVPDFTMDLKTRKVTSRSSEPKNPAFRIIVRQKNVPQDTTWAMLNMPPHFARNSMLAFEIERIDFVGHDPIVRQRAARPPGASDAPQVAPSHPSTRKDEKTPR